MIVSKPKEECDMEPHETCRFITKMVPHLRSREECVEVPQEVCGTSRAPVKKQRPAIMNWCYNPDQKPSVLASSSPVPAPPPGVTASPGQVVLKEVQFRFRDSSLTTPSDLFTLGDEISIELFGEKTVASPNGVTCSFSFDDIQSYQTSIINDKEMTISDDDELGGCYRVNSQYTRKEFLSDCMEISSFL